MNNNIEIRKRIMKEAEAIADNGYEYSIGYLKLKELCINGDISTNEYVERTISQAKKDLPIGMKPINGNLLGITDYDELKMREREIVEANAYVMLLMAE